MGKFSEFKLPLKSIPAGTQEFSYHLDKSFFENMENADVRDADVDVHLAVTHKNDVYDLVFHLTGEGTSHISIIDGYVYEGRYKDGECWNEEWNPEEECLEDVGYFPTHDRGEAIVSLKWYD